MKLRLPANDVMLQAIIVVALFVILMALEDILHLLRSRPFVVMEYVPGPPPVIIDAEATVTEKPERPRKNGRFVKVETEPSVE